MSNSQIDRGARVFGTLSADGSTAWVRLGDLQHKLAAVCSLYVYGTWGSGTATINMALDSSGTGAHDLSTTLTADGKVDVTGYAPDVYVRVTVSGSSSPSLTFSAL